ncbi:rab2 family gtpase [Plasmopara halstedii]|uniref:Rab2 family gtpase n=1 Tax=Plasmopara halstedii TaxID=4781 RepID=A0A0P1B736_PLAHL|nr:rab2 family gtpase [Plasmopara halstedii]CEG50345.1 rab2 family gtpase [Plasmopara halstedii]|eukprot:XP_024586714.1 rab2 family gtpase [Plasmopara halstedii]
MPKPFASTPSASFVVRREKRRRQKVDGPSDIERRPRRGFKFSDKKDENISEIHAEATPVGKRKPGTPAKDNMFVFRVRKDDDKDVSKKHGVDAAAVSAALRAKQEKAARAEMRRLVRQKKREEVLREELNEEEMKRKNLSTDQMLLYHMVQRQVKRELRKVRKEFLTSAARRDIMQLSEISLQTMKQELISFMAEHQPGNVAIKIANPENARMRAMIETCEQRMKSLVEEEKIWLEMKTTLEVERLAISDGAASKVVSDTSKDVSDTSKVVSDTIAVVAQEEDGPEDHEEQEILPCELKVSQSLNDLQRTALQQLSSTTKKLSLLNTSMLTVNRLIVEAEIKKAQLFSVYHDSAFKGYDNIAQPKESVRALLKLPARGGVP